MFRRIIRPQPLQSLQDLVPATPSDPHAALRERHAWLVAHMVHPQVVAIEPERDIVTSENKVISTLVRLTLACGHVVHSVVQQGRAARGTAACSQCASQRARHSEGQQEDLFGGTQPCG